jgi:peptidoglycan-associated lipoprotein
MRQRAWPILLALTAITVTSVLLSGCSTAKSGAPGGAAGSASGSGPGGMTGSGMPGSRSGSGAESGQAGLADGNRDGASGAPGAAGAAGGMGMAGGTGAAGTTIPALPSPSAFTEIAALRDVHFEFDRYTIRSQDGAALEQNARWLKANPRAFVLIEGHTDERGTNEYNVALGERRAAATRESLAALGIERSRVTLITYGEERPLCSERAESCWAQNRRAHFLVRQ